MNSVEKTLKTTNGDEIRVGSIVKVSSHTSGSTKAWDVKYRSGIVIELHTPKWKSVYTSLPSVTVLWEDGKTNVLWIQDLELVEEADD